MNRVFTLLILILIGQTLRAQKSVDAGIMLGVSNYSGELTETSFQNYHFAFGLVGRYNINDHFSLKGNAFYGHISGADSLGPESFHSRNLSFKSELFEFAALLEWNLWAFDPIGKRKGKKAFTPFMFVGAAVYKYNPKAYFEDPNSDFKGWVELQPMGTEGQGTTQFQDRKKYNLTQVSIPVGGGIKLRLAPGWTLGLEYGLRKTFNDYIDDVSMTYVEPTILDQNYGSIAEGGYSASLADRSSDDVRNSRSYDPLTFTGPGRGNPKTNDWYAYGGITITYTIFGNRVKCFTF